MLGSILRLQKAKALPCGVYGSFGWSGEAVEQLQDRLTDAGFQTVFKPIRAQFRPDAKVLQVCEESGTDLAQIILKSKKKTQKAAEKRSSSITSSQVPGAPRVCSCVWARPPLL
ncbi:MAG: FprA family A-type flavoprotein [Akkermansiaceae bacterium]|nr:FprA family A-type flavoprotein [Akkermansiaceae bacterium]